MVPSGNASETALAASPNFGSGLANGHARDAGNFLPKQIDGVLEKPTMELLDFDGALRVLSEGLLGRRECSVKRDDQRVSA